MTGIELVLFSTLLNTLVSFWPSSPICQIEVFVDNVKVLKPVKCNDLDGVETIAPAAHLVGPDPTSAVILN